MTSLFGNEIPQSKRDFELGELKLALEIAEKRAFQSDANLRVISENLDKCRSDYSNAYLELAAIREKIAFIKLRAANILVNREDIDAEQAVMRLIADLNGLKFIHAKIIRELTKFRQQMNAVLDVLDADDTVLGSKLNLSLDSIFRSLSEAGGFYFGDSPFGATDADINDTRVVAVNGDIGVVVLNVGRQHGVRPGTTWAIEGPDRRSPEIKIIEVRHRLCAGHPVAGRLRDVSPGARAKQLTEIKD